MDLKWRTFRLAVPLVSALTITACNAGGIAGVPAPFGVFQGPTQHRRVPEWLEKHQAKAVCQQVAGKPTCLALLVQENGVARRCSPSSNCGWTPAQLQAAYGLTDVIGRGSGTNVAVIAGGDDGNASSDLATYRSQYKLGKAKLKKYNEKGQQSHYPPSCRKYSWCLETDLDIEMVSAACQKCTIFLMEAEGSISGYEAAEAEAVKLGATILSNSWICSGSGNCGDPNLSNYFDTPGVAYLAASGDEGYENIGAPAVLGSVIAVGGTQLAQRGGKYSESLWPDAGGGCASPTFVGGSGIGKPSWQNDPDCSYRTLSDVSAEAGCAPGVAVYTTLYYHGWTSLCGTSAATPFTAGVIALAGNGSSQNGGENFWVLSQEQHQNYFHHPSGTGTCGNYLCADGRYKKFYSGPGGWGTPDGIKGY